MQAKKSADFQKTLQKKNFYKKFGQHCLVVDFWDTCIYIIIQTNFKVTKVLYI